MLNYIHMNFSKYVNLTFYCIVLKVKKLNSFVDHVLIMVLSLAFFNQGSYSNFVQVFQFHQIINHICILCPFRMIFHHVLYWFRIDFLIFCINLFCCHFIFNKKFVTVKIRKGDVDKKKYFDGLKTRKNGLEKN